MGVGYGAYQAVDWALALDVLPKGSNIAKDMGVWHVAMVSKREARRVEEEGPAKRGE